MYLYLFFIVFVAGFIGSLQPGPINTNVVLSTLEYKYKKAMNLALAGSIVQGLGGLIAFLLVSKFQNYLPNFNKAFLAPFFLFVGLYYLLQNEVKQIKREKEFSGFGQGLVLAIFNPQIIPYWVLVFTFLKSTQFSFGTAIIASISAFLGTFSVLFLYMKLASLSRLKLDTLLARKILGICFIVLSIFVLF